MSFYNEGINGSTAPSIESDELAQKQQPKIPQQESVGKESLIGTTSESLGKTQKLFFIGVIVMVCVAFVKTRKRGPVGRGSKSMV